LHLVTRNDTHKHTHTPTHLVGLLCTRDRPVAETSTWGQTTFTRDKHPRLRRESKPSRWAAADLWLR